MPVAPGSDYGAALATLFDAADEGLLAFSATGDIAYGNASAFELFGVNESALGTPVERLGSFDLTTLVRGALAGDIADKPVLIDAEDRELACRVWRSADGALAVGVSVHDDSAIVGRRDRIEAVLNATQDGLIVFTPDNEITYANPAAIEMLHTSEEELIGVRTSVDDLLGVEVRPLSEKIPCWELTACAQTDCPAYESTELRCWLLSGTLCCAGDGPVSFRDKMERCRHCKVYELDAEAFDALSGDEFEEIEIDQEGTPLIAKLRVTPVIDEDGDYMGRVLTVRDITREYEISQMKNEFVSTVSHELRTPMTSIKGYVDLILDGDAGEINDIQREFLGIVQENSDRLVELINDMLDISRIESGRIHIKVEPLLLQESIKDAVSTFDAVNARNGRTVIVDVDDALPPVAGDRDRVNQVLINFVSNAIKYSPEGGDVVVRAQQTGDTITASVTDSGLGISVEDQKLLFTKFFRVDSAITREIGGTGLGLSICKSIIELLGGTIGCQSELGAGSTFYFSLPLATPDMVRTPKVAGPEGARGTVLVVDRDPEVAALIETYLKRHGYDVVQAHNAEEALSTALRIQPDAITLDVILDDDDGFDLLQRFKDVPETAGIPVVVLSIVCDEGKSCRFGAANYLEKPIDQDRLVSILNDLVGSKTSPVALVVDDDRDIVSLLGESLRKRGFAVVSAYDGAEALAAIAERKPDIMLLDLRMPKMDGYEVITAVKRSAEWADIPVVVMTAHPIDSEQAALIELAAVSLEKPITPEDIVSKVDEILGITVPHPAVGSEV